MEGDKMGEDKLIRNSILGNKIKRDKYSEIN